MRYYQSKLIYPLLALLLSLIFSACGGLETQKIDKDSRLKQRLESYIDARKQADLAGMQSLYLKPEKAKVGNIVVKESEIVSIKIEEGKERAQTQLKNKIQAMGFTFDKVPMTLKWVWNNNDWFIVVPNSSSSPFPGTGKSEQ